MAEWFTPQATDVLPGTKRAPRALRREVIRTLGIVGALDPEQYPSFADKTRKGGAVGGGYFAERESKSAVDSHTQNDGHRSGLDKSDDEGNTSVAKTNSALAPSTLPVVSSEVGDDVNDADDDMPSSPVYVRAVRNGCAASFDNGATSAHDTD